MTVLVYVLNMFNIGFSSESLSQIPEYINLFPNIFKYKEDCVI